MTDLSILKNLDEAWERADSGPGPAELPPDGDYQAVIQRFDFIENKTRTWMGLKTEMRIVSGQAAGQTVETLHSLSDPDRLGFLKKHLQAIEIPIPDSLADLESVLHHGLDAVVDVTVKTSDRVNAEGRPYRNLYVNRRVHHGSDIPAEIPTQASLIGRGPQNAIDDDIPFLWSGPRDYEQRYHNNR